MRKELEDACAQYRAGIEALKALLEANPADEESATASRV